MSVDMCSLAGVDSCRCRRRGCECRLRERPMPPRRGGRAAEGGGLLNRYTDNTVSRVRIPPSPMFAAFTCREGTFIAAYRWWSRKRDGRAVVAQLDRATG